MSGEHRAVTQRKGELKVLILSGRRTNLVINCTMDGVRPEGQEVTTYQRVSSEGQDGCRYRQRGIK